MKVATYVRVSTEHQDLERQLQTTDEYASQLAETYDTYRDTATGTNTNREQFRRLLAAAETYDAIVTTSVSRLARSVRDFEDVVDRIVDDAGTELHIINEGFEIRPDDTDPYQRAMLQMLSVFAELVVVGIVRADLEALANDVEFGASILDDPINDILKIAHRPGEP